MNKQLPFSLETEKQIILGLVQSPRLLVDILDSVNTNDLYDPRSKKIYDTIVKLHLANRPITEEFITEEILKTDSLFDFNYLVDFYGCTESEMPLLVEHLKGLSMRRQIILKAQALIEKLHESKPIDQLKEEIDRSLFQMSISSKTGKHISQLVMATFENIKRRKSGKNVVKTGFQELDNATSGFFGGQLIILAARTSVGKTSFAVSLAHNVMSLGKKVLFISLEMPSDEIVMKTLAIESQIDFKIIANDAVNDPRYHNDLVESAQRLENFPLFIEDSCYTLSDIKAVIRKLKKEEDIDLVIIDYLGLIVSERQKENRAIEIGYMTRDLKLFAKELEIPIVLLAQVNREADKGNLKALDNRPKLHHLKDSGSIEQDGDIIIFLYREWLHNKEADIHETELIIAKQRLGPIGTHFIHYQPGIMQFRDNR